jgi:hypothetical protein
LDLQTERVLYSLFVLPSRWLSRCRQPPADNWAWCPSRTGTRRRINALGWLTGPNPLIGRKRLYLVLAHRRDQLSNATMACSRSAWPSHSGRSRAGNLLRP